MVEDGEGAPSGVVVPAMKGVPSQSQGLRFCFCAATSTDARMPPSSNGEAAETIKVSAPAHLTNVMEFHSGATIPIATSFDVIKHKHNLIEIYGWESSMMTPDPNNLSGKVEIFRDGVQAREDIPVDHPPAEGAPGHLGLRGPGAAEMVDFLRAGRQHRVLSELAFHVFEVVTAFEWSAQPLKVEAIHGSCGSPDRIPQQIEEGHFT